MTLNYRSKPRLKLFQKKTEDNSYAMTATTKGQFPTFTVGVIAFVVVLIADTLLLSTFVIYAYCTVHAILIA